MSDRAKPADARALTNIFTVDLEDYFQVSAFDATIGLDRWPGMESRLRASTDQLLQLLSDADVKATFFVLGWNAERMPELVRHIVAEGHEIASHGYSHQLVYRMAPESFRADLKRARQAIEQATATRVVGYRAPSYSVTAGSLWALDILIEEGYVFDSSIFPIRHDRYGIPSAPRRPYFLRRNGGGLWEVPPAAVRICGINLPFGGGAYLRLLPFWWTRWGLRRLNERERTAAVVYTHPWEIDTEQPRLEVDAFTRVRHYGNLHRVHDRLRRLLREFRFAPINTVLAGHLQVGAGEPRTRLAS